jgi:carboxyl-terminal processing protease
MRLARRCVVVLSVLAAVLANGAGLKPAHAAVLSDPSPGQLDEVARLIDKHYVLAIAPDSLAAAAHRCFAGTLDRYSGYLDAMETAEFERSLAGHLGGIGAGFDFYDSTGVPHVAFLFLRSPALGAGLRLGDTLLAVDGRSMRGLSMQQTLGTIRGKPGTRVRLRVRAAGAESHELSIRRAVIDLPSVRGFRAADDEAGRWLLDPGTRIAYVRIENFTARTPQEFDDALAALRRVDARALVLDLRDDPGGLLRSAVAVADRLLAEGPIVTVQTRGEHDEVAAAHASVATTVPLAILVNGSTASAAEVLAASLQDHHRGLVVGSRSFGKGVVQNLYHLKRTPGMVKITTSVYQRPSGGPMETHIPGIGSERGGVWPDSGLTVTLAEDEAQSWSDATLRATYRMQQVTATPDTVGSVLDRVLDRAVEVLAPVAP